jgi:hypothetical protein
MQESKSPLRLRSGDRVRLNQLGKERSPKIAVETGVIVGRTRGSGFYVLLDGNATPSLFHHTYIDRDEDVPSPSVTSS